VITPWSHVKMILGRLASIFAFCVVVFCFGALGFWTADRKPPVEVLATDLITKEVAPGGELLVKRTVSRDRQCATKVDRIFVDSQGFRYVLDNQSFSIFGPLGTDSYVTSTPVPMQMAKGPAKYYAAVEYNCNPVQAVWPIRRSSVPIDFIVR